MLRIACVAAARPNFIKAKPVVDALTEVGFDVSIVHTGQHYDHDMSQVFFDDLGIRAPDYHLRAETGSHARQTASVLVQFEELLEKLPLDRVLVFGDVNSTLAVALAATKVGVPVDHVEAGLRSRDRTMPEEINRILTDQISENLFAPSQDACDNLLEEGFPAHLVHLVGNVMIDSLFSNLGRARSRKRWESYGLFEGEYGLVTLHRPGNVDSTERAKKLISLLSSVSKAIPLLFPVHPRSQAFASQLSSLVPSIVTIPPLGYLDFISLQCGAKVVLTDSGGIQEETTALGIPCITLRDNTERPITVIEGSNTLVGTDVEKALLAVQSALDGTTNTSRPPLWDGQAARRIAHILR